MNCNKLIGVCLLAFNSVQKWTKRNSLLWRNNRGIRQQMEHKEYTDLLFGDKIMKFIVIDKTTENNKNYNS